MAAFVAPGERNWWKDVVIYQIYPSSFKDGNGDGLGDLPGITSKLDYIKSLGVGCIWLSPHYDSPQVDMGYDIANYEAVYPPYGNMDDMDNLIKQVKARGMRLILDLVINHTSDQHQWFKESRSSRDSPKRNWYIWEDGKMENGKRVPPNNLRGHFSEPSWTWDEHTQQYYMNLFAPEQPDLNWENEETRKAIYDSAIHFWLKKGIDGFRVDTVNMYSKGDYLNKNAPVTEPWRHDQPAGGLHCNGPRIHEFIREMNREALRPYGDVMTVGELPNVHTKEHMLSFVSAADPQLSMVFQFDVVDLGTGKGRKFGYSDIPLPLYKSTWANLQDTTADGDGWNSVFIENHDQARAVSRFANDDPRWRALGAKVLATQIATLRGTLFIYQGQEIGMVNVPKTWGLEEYKDTNSIHYAAEIAGVEGDAPAIQARTLDELQHLARDHSRVPVQWSDEPFAGFSTKEPWMRVNDSYKEINVAQQEQDSGSVLAYYKKMLAFRKAHVDTIVAGSYTCLDPAADKTFTYIRKSDKEEILVVLNFSEDEVPVPAVGQGWDFALGNYELGEVGIGVDEKLRGWESRVYVRAV